MPAAQALCYHAAAAELEDRPLPGPSFAERDILARLKHQPRQQQKSQRQRQSAKQQRK